MINKKLLTMIALVVTLLVPQGAWADQISGDATVQNFGSSSATSWMVSDTNKGLTNKVKTGSIVTLDGITMTFGGTDDAWDYIDNNAQALITDMPNNNGTGVTSITDGTAIPTHGGVYTFVASKTGSITIYGSEAGSASKIYYGEISDGKASSTQNFSNSNNVASRTFSVEAGKSYFFFQGAKDAGTISSYRYSLKGISFNIAEEEIATTYKAWNFVEETTEWTAATRAFSGNYDGLTIKAPVTFEDNNRRYVMAANSSGSISFKVNATGYLVIHGKVGASNKTVTLTIGETSSNILKTTSGSVYCQKVTPSSETLIKISASSDAAANVFGVYWIPENSTEDTNTKSVTLDSKGFATYRPAYSVSIPSGINAYYLTTVDPSAGTITASSALETKIPAGSAVILTGESNTTYNFSAYNLGNAYGAISYNSAAGGTYDDNKLYGAYKSGIELNPDDYDYYGYVKGEGKFGKVTSTVTIPEGRCYFKVAKSAGARDFFVFDFSDSETTGIDATLNEKGQMTNDKGIYNFNGQRVAQPTRGLYIVNGKKVIIK